MSTILKAGVLLPVVACALCVVTTPSPVLAAGSELSTEPIPLAREEDLPSRAPPIIEIGPAFLGTGNIPPGFTLPTGAVWTPALYVIGEFRTGVHYFDNGPGPENQEFANRLDVFANVQFTPTERFLIGMSPLNVDFDTSGYTRKGARGEGWHSRFNANITTLFFEGELGEIFPGLDPDDREAFDIGFSVGRQPITFQEGIMINDTIDAVGINRDTVMFRDLSVDTRATALFGWGEIDRSNNQDDNGAYLVGFFTETDFRSNTLNLDFIYVFNSDDFGDGWYAGISSTQRIGHYNTAFRVNVSRAMDQRNAAVDDGILLFAEVSRTLPYSEDFVYATSFLSLDNYTSAARSPLVGGPLGRAGILFAAIGLGTYGTPLSNRADNTMGGALGYQMFFNNQRTNLVLELGGRTGTDGREDASVALGARLQFAIGARSLIQFDAFVAGNEGRDDGAGLRSEYLLRF